MIHTLMAKWGFDKEKKKTGRTAPNCPCTKCRGEQLSPPANSGAPVYSEEGETAGAPLSGPIGEDKQTDRK